MKKFRLFVSLLLTLALVLPLTKSPASAESISTKQTVAAPADYPATVLSNTLQEQMVTADKDERIPVTIRLNDSIDLDAVEQKAITRANLSAAEKAILSF